MVQNVIAPQIGNKMFDDEEQMIAWLEEEGALVWTGMDENGERILNINPEKMLEVYPELYAVMLDDISEGLEELKELGLVESFIDDDGVERFMISEEGKRIMSKHGYGFNTND